MTLNFSLPMSPDKESDQQVVNSHTFGFYYSPKSHCAWKVNWCQRLIFSDHQRIKPPWVYIVPTHPPSVVFLLFFFVQCSKEGSKERQHTVRVTSFVSRISFSSKDFNQETLSGIIRMGSPSVYWKEKTFRILFGCVYYLISVSDLDFYSLPLYIFLLFCPSFSFISGPERERDLFTYN